MKYLKYYYCLFNFFIASNIFSQCSFEYLSNDTVYQDYIEFIYPRKDADEIVTIGSRINRGIINSSIFNAPVFKTFDYCGNIQKNIYYKVIDNIDLRHRDMPTHNTYKYEPIGNKVIKTENDEFLIVDNGYDNRSNELVLILFKINEKGELKNYKILNVNDHEGNHTTIKHVLQLKDGKILVILWDYINEYIFFYFDSNSDFLYKKTFNLPRGIRSLKETENGDFICTSLVYDSLSFQFYRLDTSGQIKWIVSPYSIFGSASEVLIENNKIYVTGGVSYGGKGEFGAFLICDFEGNILKQFKFDTISTAQRLCSVHVESDNSFIITGYIYNQIDNIAEDVAILKIDSNGNVNFLKLFNFESSLGTTGPRGSHPDYGGFGVNKANDGGIITYGISRYRDKRSGVVSHEDATLIKTEPIILSTTDNNRIPLHFEILSNPINAYLDIRGPTHLIKYWIVYNLNGEEVINGTGWNDGIDVRKLTSGVYTMRIVDRNSNQYFLKFVKI